MSRGLLFKEAEDLVWFSTHSGVVKYLVHLRYCRYLNEYHFLHFGTARMCGVCRLLNLSNPQSLCMLSCNLCFYDCIKVSWLRGM